MSTELRRLYHAIVVCALYFLSRPPHSEPLFLLALPLTNATSKSGRLAQKLEVLAFSAALCRNIGHASSSSGLGNLSVQANFKLGQRPCSVLPVL